MNIIDSKTLLTPKERNLLQSYATMPFNLGGFCSLDDILTKLAVDVHIVSGSPKREVPPFLREALADWMEMVRKINDHMDISDDESEKKFLNEERMKVFGIIQFLQGQMSVWSSMRLRGLYDSERNIIELYPEEMVTEYGGTRMNELLVSTLAHETMHAYFDRDGHSGLPYVPTVEEPLAEFGMLLYLKETGNSYYNWAYKDVKKKHTCYKYGANLMDQHLKESMPYPIRQFLEAYKIPLPDYTVMMKPWLSGEIVLSSAKKSGLGVDETPISGVGGSKKAPFPIAPPPYPSHSPMALPVVVVQEKMFCRFVLEVFKYLKENSLLNALYPYLSTISSKNELKALSLKDYFLLRRVFLDCSFIPTKKNLWWPNVFDINGKEYFLSKNNWSESSTHNHFDDFANMIRYVFDKRFDIRKGKKKFVLIDNKR